MHTDFLNQLEANYTRVFNYTGGHPDLRVVTLIAAQYTFANKVYSGVEQQAIIDRLDAGNSFLDLRAFGGSLTFTYKIAGQLLLSNQPIEERLMMLKEQERILAACGFRKSPYRIAGAFFIEDTAHAIRAKNLYDAMHKHHPILTRKSDLPFAVFLTIKDETSAVLRAQTMHDYFVKLRTEGFKVSDSLQTLTQLLTLFDVQYREDLAYYVIKLRDALVEQGIKLKKMHYPYISLLALTATDLKMVQKIVVLEEQLRQTKALKHVQELALIFAIQKLIRDYSEAQNVIQNAQIGHWSDLLEFSDLFMFLDLSMPESITGLFDIQFDF